MDIRPGYQGWPSIIGTGSERVSGTGKADGASASGTPTGSQTLGTDRAQLSLAGALASVASTLPDVRADKVSAVQQALAAGTYNVSAQDVAGALVKHLLGN